MLRCSCLSWSMNFMPTSVLLGWDKVPTLQQLGRRLSSPVWVSTIARCAPYVPRLVSQFAKSEGPMRVCTRTHPPSRRALMRIYTRGVLPFGRSNTKSRSPSRERLAGHRRPDRSRSCSAPLRGLEGEFHPYPEDATAGWNSSMPVDVAGSRRVWGEQNAEPGGGPCYSRTMLPSGANSPRGPVRLPKR